MNENEVNEVEFVEETSGLGVIAKVLIAWGIGVATGIGGMIVYNKTVKEKKMKKMIEDSLDERGYVNQNPDADEE